MAQSFKIIVSDEDDDWIPVDQLLGESQHLVDYYISVENLHCCDFLYFNDKTSVPP